MHCLGTTKNPDSSWVSQQARNLWVGERREGVRLMIRGRDSKYSGPFDEIFRTEGVKIIKTPIRAPRANAFAERWVRTARRECLDHLLILARRHLEGVPREFVGHYDAERPHRGLLLVPPSPPTSSRSASSTHGLETRPTGWPISVSLRRYQSHRQPRSSAIVP